MKYVLILIAFSVLLIALDKVNLLSYPRGLIERGLSFRINFPNFFENQEVKKLREENIKLMSKLIDQKNLKLENEALRIQLNSGKTTVGEKNLMVARVVGRTASAMLIDKGEKDGVASGTNVLYENILVGRAVAVSQYRSKVELPTSIGSKIPAKTESGAIGIVTGNGGAMFLDKVTLGEQISEDDLVLTAGSLTQENELSGYLPDLIIGKITQVKRLESALFQQAQMQSPLDTKKLEFVFLVP